MSLLSADYDSPSENVADQGPDGEEISLFDPGSSSSSDGEETVVPLKKQRTQTASVDQDSHSGLPSVDELFETVKTPAFIQAKASASKDKGLMGGDQIQDQNADLLNKSPPTRASTLIVQPEEAQIQESSWKCDRNPSATACDDEASRSKLSKQKTFQQREKRKRAIGQSSRGKNYVEEEKRILRKSGMNFGYD